MTRPGTRLATSWPLVPGVELAGTVVQSSCGDFVAGRRVLVQGYDLGVTRHGGFAAYARVPVEWVVPLPDALSCRDAAIIGIAGFTALVAMRRLLSHGIAPGAGPVLVTGASGGVGTRRSRSWLTRGSKWWRPRASRLSATTWRASVQPRWWDVSSPRTTAAPWARARAGVVDCVGGDALAQALRTLRYGGAVVASGVAGGNELSTTVYPFIVRGARSSESTPCPRRSVNDGRPGWTCPRPSRWTAAKRWCSKRSRRRPDRRARPRVRRRRTRPYSGAARRPRQPRSQSANTGDTLIVPLSQGAMARRNVGDEADAPGMVTVATSDAGQLVADPLGTSESW